MKKIYAISLAVLSLAAISCQKENKTVEVQPQAPVKTFTVQAPDTKTTADEFSVKWAAGDQITVYGYSEGEAAAEAATFTLISGAGESSAVFEGTMKDEHETYYAFYPASVETEFIPGEKNQIQVLSKSSLQLANQKAVENGFDPSFALMTAKANTKGVLEFRHGVSYFKVELADDDITGISLTFGKNAVQKRPSYDAEEGIIAVSNSNTNVIGAVGNFKKGGIYYIAAIPHSSNKMTSLELTLTKKDGSTGTITTTHPKIADAQIGLGDLMNLGCPSVSFKEPDPVVGGIGSTTWDFSSQKWQEVLSPYGNAGDDISNWDVTVDGLQWYSKANSRWNTTYIQAGGVGSTSDRYFKFTASAAGTLKVWSSNTGGSVDNERKVTVNTGTEESKPGGSASPSQTENEFTISKAGDVYIYATGNALRFYKIEYIVAE